jgi:hypothetical protein
MGAVDSTCRVCSEVCEPQEYLASQRLGGGPLHRAAEISDLPAVADLVRLQGPDTTDRLGKLYALDISGMRACMCVYVCVCKACVFCADVHVFLFPCSCVCGNLVFLLGVNVRV